MAPALVAGRTAPARILRSVPDARVHRTVVGRGAAGAGGGSLAGLGRIAGGGPRAADEPGLHAALHCRLPVHGWAEVARPPGRDRAQRALARVVDARRAGSRRWRAF